MPLRVELVAMLMLNAACGSAVFYEEVAPLEDRDVWVEGPSVMLSHDDAETADSCSARLGVARTQVLTAIESSIARRRMQEAECLGRQAKVLRTMHIASLGGTFEAATGDEPIDLGEDLCAAPLREVVATARGCDQGN